MIKVLDRIQAGEVLLSDGAMGTELQKRGLPTGACPEEFNVTHAEIVQSIYRDYYRAGSDIIETNTFGGTRSRLAIHGKENEVYRFNRRGAELAREVCPPGRFVAGSMGPTGEILEPLGTLSVAKAYDYFAEQAEALAEGGVDIIYVETMMAIEEAEIAVKAVKEKTGLPVVGSMTFNLTDGGVRTSMGVDAATMVGRLTAVGADLLGANCGTGVEVVLAAIEEMQPLSPLPFLAQPNAGIPQMTDHLIVYPETPQSFEQKIEQVLQFRIGILGGCCGTGPEHIIRLRTLLNKHHPVG